MNKTLIAIATAVIAAMTMFASGAEAGFKVRLGFGFPLGGFTAHGNSGHYEHRRQKKHVHRKAKKAYVATKKSPRKASEVANTQGTPTTPSVANVAPATENSSITTAVLPPAEVKDTDTTTEPAEKTAEAVAGPPQPALTSEPHTAKKLDCKKFFPSVGMTLTVPCE